MKQKEINLDMSVNTNRILNILFLSWILVIDILFYSESFGLNALIVAVISILIFGKINPSNLSKIKWWAASLIWLFTAIGVFVNGHAVAILAYYFAFFFFTAINNNSKLSIPLGLFQGIVACALGFINYFVSLKKMFSKSAERKNKWLIHLLMITIPLTIILIFLKLYQVADKDFYEMTKYINLDFISWGFLLTYLFLSFFLYGFFFYQNTPEADVLESKLKNQIDPNYKDRIQNYFGVQNEKKIGLIMLVALNAMLILYNLLDVSFILGPMNDPNSDETFSEIVHAGIYALIFSIVLVIIIVTYLLRGQLNFQENKWIKPLIVFWLIQNFFMVATTSIKNYEYIYFWGLTYKRIGVFIYLLLAIIGLSLTLYKVARKKSIWFLMRNTSLAFALCLSALLTFNWNRGIALYNTTFVAEERIDFEYLHSLGPDTYFYILQEHEEHESVNPLLIYQIMDEIPEILLKYSRFDYNHSWRSFVWSDFKNQQELKSKSNAL
jgi:Domain of unknown function (DUF4153)